MELARKLHPRCGVLSQHARCGESDCFSHSPIIVPVCANKHIIILAAKGASGVVVALCGLACTE